jgi:CspA family cold shock protein
MQTGIVKWFNVDKGYGFIVPDDGTVDMFVHVTALEDSGIAGIAEGQRVSYSVGLNTKTKRQKAVNLKVIDQD